MKSKMHELKNLKTKTMGNILTTILALVIVSVLTACSEGLSGTYYGTYEGAKVACQMEQEGNQLKGIIQDELGSVFEFSGNYTGSTSSGEMVANKTYALVYSASISGNTCTFTIRSANGEGNTIKVLLTKSSSSEQTTTATNASYNSDGNIDEGVVGRWMHESITSTGGSADYASVVSVSYYEYNADGTYCFRNGGSAGGGDGWGYYSGAENGASCGKWYVKDGYLYSLRDGKTYSVKYTLYNGQLVFGTKGNYTFLKPAN